MTEVRVEGVTVRFGDQVALDNVGFQVDDGEMCVIVGPSGCGKTLILRVVAGLTRPDAGHVYMDGQLMDNVPPRDRDVAMCFQTFALYPSMTVRENWTFPLRAASLPQDEIERRVSEVARLLDMEPLLERYPDQLSGGQQQRVAAGRALVRRPRLFLLDEPMGNLDAKIRVQMRVGIKKMQMDLGITTIYVTHDQIEAQAIGDKMVVMDIANVQQIGTPEEIYEKPANLYVAGFIGTPRMNFIDCELERRNGDLTIVHPRFRLRLPAETAGRVESQAESSQVVLGVRPENVEVSPTPTEDSIPAEVYVIEPQSNEVIVDLSFEDRILQARINRDQLTFQPELNQRVYMQFVPELVHVFDRRSGRRIS
ncbi:MAG: ABC transporter ATP-binding protein [Chloroflexi bacterium]|nr:MAG: ABC transporter ATP-binding protein [Chloroflexota bacterium]